MSSEYHCISQQRLQAQRYWDDIFQILNLKLPIKNIIPSKLVFHKRKKNHFRQAKMEGIYFTIADLQEIFKGALHLGGKRAINTSTKIYNTSRLDTLHKRAEMDQALFSTTNHQATIILNKRIFKTVKH